jgi:hypothetical protein
VTASNPRPQHALLVLLLLTLVSTSSYALACLSQSAELRMSANRMHPLLLLYAKMLQCLGWNSADVITCADTTAAAAAAGATRM